MRTVRFVNKEKQQFASALRKNVNNYFKEKGISTKDNGSMAVKSAVMLSLYLAPFVLLITVHMNAWIGLLSAALMGVGMAGTGMSVMHDSVHGSFSKKSWLNKLMSSSMYLMGGNIFNWKMQHNIFHHTFTNIDGYDEDIRSRLIIRMSPHAPLRKIHRFQFIYSFFLYCFMTISIVLGDFGRLWKYNRSGVLKSQNADPVKEFTKMIATKIAYFIVILGLPLWLTDFTWWQILIGFMTVHMVASGIMGTVFQMAHVVEGTEQPLPSQEGNIENEWAIHQLQTTANFSRNSRIMSWFIGGLNFQIEHHLFPNICHIHYKKISPIVEQTAREFGLSYNLKPSFFQALGSHVRTLKMLGKKPVPVTI